MNYFRYKQFNKDVITVAVGYYLRYALSYRDISEILRERGVNVHHSTVYRWVQEYAPILYQIWKKKHKKAYYKWRIDETYIKIKGKWSYLYRAIDAEGHTLDIWLRKQRDNHSAYAFIKRLIKQFGKPQKVITDQAPSTKVAMAKVIKAFKLKPDCHCTSKYLNNLIEQDHRHIKVRKTRYQSINTAKNTLKGIECIYALEQIFVHVHPVISVFIEIKSNGNLQRALKIRVLIPHLFGNHRSHVIVQCPGSNNLIRCVLISAASEHGKCQKRSQQQRSNLFSA